MEGLEKEGLGLLNKDRVKVNPASEFPGIFPAVLATGDLSQRQRKNNVPLSCPLGKLLAEFIVRKAFSTLRRCVGVVTYVRMHAGDVCPCLMGACMQVMHAPDPAWWKAHFLRHLASLSSHAVPCCVSSPLALWILSLCV